MEDEYNTDFNRDIGNWSGITVSKFEKVQKIHIFISSALKTHLELETQDIIFGTKSIIKYYEKFNLDDEKLTHIILHIYKLSNTGRFSIKYNEKLDKLIKDKEDLEEFLNTSIRLADFFPELYDNKLLSPKEFKSIESMKQKEYYAILNTLEQLKYNKSDITILPYKVEDKPSIYSKCYKDICIYENLELGTLPGNHIIPQKIYLADSSSGENKSYCFDVMEIVANFSNNNFDNPKTHKPFSGRARNQLLTKYNKEIKMYTRYLEYLELE